MPGRIRQHGQINTQQLQPLVITLRGGCFKQNARVGADGEPGIGGQFMLKSRVREGTQAIVVFPPQRVMNALPKFETPGEDPARRPAA